MNRTLKARISSYITLNELFLRLLNLHEDASNHDFEVNEIETMMTTNTHMLESKMLENIKDRICPYSFGHTLIMTGKALSYSITHKNTYFQVSKENYSYRVKKIPNKLLECECYYYKSMIMPCEHILTCITRSTDTEANRPYQENLLQIFHERWLLAECPTDNPLIDFVKGYRFLKIGEEESKAEAEILNDQKKEELIEISLQEISMNSKIEALEEFKSIHSRKNNFNIKFTRRKIK